MKIKCINRELTEEQRALLKAPSRFNPRHALTVGNEYLVVGIVSIIESPQYGNAPLFEIVDDSRHLALYPAPLFEVTDGRCSAYWMAVVSDDGSMTLRPEELNRKFFHDDLSEGDPASRKLFQELIAKLEAESADPINP